MGLKSLALKIERGLKLHDCIDDMLLYILQDCEFYSQAEVKKFKQTLVEYKKLSLHDLIVKKAELYFELKQYKKALKLFQSILEISNDMEEKDKAEAWNGIASCYARMLQYTNAFNAYQEAYKLFPKEDYLKGMYYLTKLQKSLQLSDADKENLTEELMLSWKEAFEIASEEVNRSEVMVQIEPLFHHGVMRRNTKVLHLIGRWKQQYRHMG